MPLIISPFYNPPKQVSLPSSYKSLPQQLAPSLYYSNYRNNAASLNAEDAKNSAITKDIESWIGEIENIKNSIESFGAAEEAQYKKWLNENIKHYAPGYLDSVTTGDGILKPKQTPNHSQQALLSSSGAQSPQPGANTAIPPSSSLNQLSDVFLNTSLQ